MRKDKNISIKKSPIKVAVSVRPLKKEEEAHKQQEEVEIRILSAHCYLTTQDCVNQMMKNHPIVVFSKHQYPHCHNALEAS